MRHIRIILLILCIGMVFCFLCDGLTSAKGIPEPVSSNPGQQRWQYINYVSISFTIVGGKAEISSGVSARNCTSVKQRVVLEIKVGGNWQSVKEWVQTDSGTSSFFYDNSYSINGTGWRVVSYVTIYDGSRVVEEIKVEGPER